LPNGKQAKEKFVFFCNRSFTYKKCKMITNDLNLNTKKIRYLQLWLGPVLAALWFALNMVFPRMEPTGIPMVVTRLFVQAAILAGLWKALSKTEIKKGVRVTIWVSSAVILTAWFILIAELAANGKFAGTPGDAKAFPFLPLAILIPVILGLVFLTRSQMVGKLLDSIPATWLVALQLYRILGVFFLVNWAHGLSPAVFAFPAGVGDVTVGILALPMAVKLASGTKTAHRSALWWNIFGLLDLSTAIILGVMTSPGGLLSSLNPGRASVEVGTFPTVMTPGLYGPNFDHAAYTFYQAIKAGDAARLVYKAFDAATSNTFCRPNHALRNSQET
jgi:hypothetical protein